MACQGQIESHVSYIMTARDLMRDAEDTQLSRSCRLSLLCDAANLVRVAISIIGELPNLKSMLYECATKFLEVCQHERPVR